MGEHFAFTTKFEQRVRMRQRGGSSARLTRTRSSQRAPSKPSSPSRVCSPRNCCSSAPTLPTARGRGRSPRSGPRASPKSSSDRATQSSRWACSRHPTCEGERPTRPPTRCTSQGEETRRRLRGPRLTRRAESSPRRSLISSLGFFPPPPASPSSCEATWSDCRRRRRGASRTRLRPQRRGHSETALWVAMKEATCVD